MRWMKLEPITQSEVSQKDKDQYSILTHTYGIKLILNKVNIFTEHAIFSHQKLF